MTKVHVAILLERSVSPLDSFIVKEVGADMT